ncbi:HIT family protein [Aspergillus lucknowensis]|uniref:Bis(5'-adenosyl)-triphosphatase n=1 Tax=Aspergillus lucknowensis TaxID=176173 RepID=A0ABR4M7U3_9EURO
MSTSSASDSSMPLKFKGGPIHFGPFLVTPQVFHQTPLSFALVNLKPILPGHVLVSPRRIVQRVADLTPPETADLFLTVRRVGRMVERVYGATSLNIAIQDGTEAGQSVPHVHAHIIPRRRRDLSTVDAVYDALDGEGGDLKRSFRGRQREEVLRVDDEERVARGPEEMEEEANMLAREMENEPVD